MNLLFENRLNAEPRASCAGAQVNDSMSAGGFQSAVQARRDGIVDAAKIHDELKSVGDAVAKGSREPGLVVELDPLHPFFLFSRTSSLLLCFRFGRRGGMHFGEVFHIDAQAEG